MPVKVSSLDHVVINVSDVARSAEWYRKILGMEVRVFDPGQGKTPRTSLMFGNQKINVRPVDGDKVDWFTADHESAGSDDLCFLTSSTPDEVVAHLKACGVAIEEAGPRQGARGVLRSVYCRDPDGSLIEISSYEEGRRALPVIAGSIRLAMTNETAAPDFRICAPRRPMAELRPRKRQEPSARLRGRINVEC